MISNCVIPSKQAMRCYPVTVINRNHILVFSIPFQIESWYLEDGILQINYNCDLSHQLLSVNILTCIDEV